MRNFRVALFGAGAMGTNHARVIAQSPHSKLSMVIDPDLQKGQKLADQYGASWEPELQNLQNLDYMVIASPTEKHFSIAMNAIMNDIPVLIEKPISNSFSETKILIDAARQRSIPLVCGLVERFNPAFLTLKAMITEVINIQTIRHSPYTPRVLNSVSADLLIHDLDLVVNLFGSNPIDLQSKSYSLSYKENPIPDAVDVLVGFSSSRFANLSVSRIGHRKIRSMSVFEKERLIEVDLLRRDITIYKHINEDVTSDGLGYKQQTVIEIPGLVTNEEPLMAQLNSFIQTISSGHSLNPSSDLDPILNIHEWLEKIENNENRNCK